MSWNITDALASSLPPGPQGPQGPQGPSGPGANDAYAQANAAFNAANAKLNIAGGTLTGTLNTQNIIPTANITYSLGTTDKKWNQIHVSTANVSAINLAGNLTATQNSTITVGATTVNTSYISANVVISGPTETTYNVFTTNADTPITIDSFPSPDFTTVKYIIQSKSIDGYHATELFCMQDGLAAYITEYATLFNNYTLGTYALTVSGGMCNLVFSPNNPDNNIITVKLVRTAITA
jgi:hypothetical protein